MKGSEDWRVNRLRAPEAAHIQGSMALHETLSFHYRSVFRDQALPLPNCFSFWLSRWEWLLFKGVVLKISFLSFRDFSMSSRELRGLERLHTQTQIQQNAFTGLRCKLFKCIVSLQSSPWSIGSFKDKNIGILSLVSTYHVGAIF